ncbi:hypothetical protein ILUMI_17386 [Ignelater luminosus]|uniref:Venom dipeptidyl peptidase 4 n=1 Tax=Ignelater luminosus TaxID=2038154 RepID=A0A8K0CR40_IGNLU|nr:hypothetical protein ILUMI_17386 [Ignelater luminosus]
MNGVLLNMQQTSVTIHTISESRGWLDIKAPTYSKDGSKYLTIGSEFENGDSYKHLVVVESRANLKRTRLTFGKKVVLSIYGWDENRQLVYYLGTRVGDPAQQHVYAVNTVTLEDKCLTCEFVTSEGLCQYAAAAFSNSFSYYTRICTGPGPTIVQVLNAETLNFFTWEDNAALKKQLEKKLLPVKKDIKVPIEGGYEARVRLLLPPELDETSSVKYPMIVNVYAGPNSNRVTDVFSLGVENYFVTNRKYIYAYIDARGSGRAGENLLFSLYRKLGTIEIEDQIAVTKYLQEHYPFIDASKTGIWGWSYGGFSTTWALIKDKQNVFSFGLAVAPVTSFIYYGMFFANFNS